MLSKWTYCFKASGVSVLKESSQQLAALVMEVHCNYRILLLLSTFSSIAFWADGLLPKSYWILGRLLKPVCWVIILPIAWSCLTKMIFHTILVDKPWFDSRIGELWKLNIYNGLKAMSHRLEIEPQFIWNKFFSIRWWNFFSPVWKKSKESIQSLDPDIILTDHCFFAWTEELNHFTSVANQIYCGIQCTAVFTIFREMSLVGLKKVTNP